MAGAGVHDWMGVSTPGLEGLWGAGGHGAGRRAPSIQTGPHVMVVGPHTVHQALDVVEGAVVQGPVQPAQAPDHQLVSVEYAQGALAMLPHFREDTQHGPWDHQEVNQQGHPIQPH